MILYHSAQNVNRVLDKLYAIAPDPLADFEREEAFHRWFYDELGKADRGEPAMVRREGNVVWLLQFNRGEPAVRCKGNVVTLLLPGTSAVKATDEEREDTEPKTNGKLQPDHSEAERFLTLLDPNATYFTFQTFDDDEARREKRKQELVETNAKREAKGLPKLELKDPFAHIIHGTLDECWDELCRLNGQSAGIFITVNATDGKGRSKDNIRRVRALFNDLDGEPLEPVLQSRQPPHIVVESSPGHFHPYRLVKDIPLDQFKPLQNKLIIEFGGDHVNDLPRVLRLPGFIHCKNKDKPSLVHIVSTREGPLYSAKDFSGVGVGNSKDAGDHTAKRPFDAFAQAGWDANKNKNSKLNEAALADLAAWVPELFPAAEPYHEGFRVASSDRGPGEVHDGCGRRWRDHDEVISFHPTGICDYAVHDDVDAHGHPCDGDPKNGSRTPIEIVMEHKFGVSAEDLTKREPTPEFEQAFEWLSKLVFGEKANQQQEDAKPEKLQFNDENQNRIYEALRHIPKGHRVDDIGEALHSLNWSWDHFDHGLEIWDWWAKYDEAYQGFKDLIARWQLFDRKKGTINTLFEIAREHGWDDTAERIKAEAYTFPAEETLARYDWLQGRHLLRREVCGTAAGGGTGKSSIAIVEVLAMTSGRQLLHDDLSGQPLRVVLINLEDNRNTMDKRIAAAMKHHRLKPEDIGDRLIVIAKGEISFKIAKQLKSGEVVRNEEVITAFTNLMIEKEADVLSIDSFIRTHAVGENENQPIEQVIECFEKIAERANCCVHLWHHTRKGKGDGQGATVESARGAASFIDACRSVRILETMSESQAEHFEILADHRQYFRAFSGKRNFAPHIEDSNWFHIKGVDLRNGPEHFPANGDNIGVVETWEAPAEEAITAEQIAQIMNALASGEWREDVRASMWAGKAIGQVIGCNHESTRGKKEIKKLIEKLFRDGYLMTVPGHTPDRKPCIFIVPKKKTADVGPFVLVCENENCGKEFESKRKGARFCSNKCRMDTFHDSGAAGLGRDIITAWQQAFSIGEEVTVEQLIAAGKQNQALKAALLAVAAPLGQDDAVSNDLLSLWLFKNADAIQGDGLRIDYKGENVWRLMQLEE